MNQAEAIEAAKALPWAKFVAMDGDGEWTAYESEPRPRSNSWACGEGPSKNRYLGCISRAPFLDTLVEVPR